MGHDEGCDDLSQFEKVDLKNKDEKYLLRTAITPLAQTYRFFPYSFSRYWVSFEYLKGQADMTGIRTRAGRLTCYPSMPLKGLKTRAIILHHGTIIAGTNLAIASQSLASTERAGSTDQAV